MKKNLLLMAATSIALASCSPTSQKEAAQDFIGKQEISIDQKVLTPEALWAMGRIGEINVSPKGDKIAYSVGYYSVAQNRSHRVIYTMNSDGTNKQLLTQSEKSESSPVWIEGGKKIAYLAPYKGVNTLWVMNADGSEKTVVDTEKGNKITIDAFKFSPDESKLLYIAQVKSGERTVDQHPDLPLASGKVITSLMYKHWDEWVESVPHPFVAAFKDNKIGASTDLLEGEPYESPMKPFGGIEQLAWSPDSKEIAYTCRKKVGKAYAFSTDSDIYLYNLATKETRNLCKEDAKDKNMGYDLNPQFSPDGTSIAWQSMERDGYESDRTRLCLYNLQDNSKRYLTESFKSVVDNFMWKDNQTLYFTSVWHGTTMIYQTDLKNHVEQLTDGQYDFGSMALGKDQLIVTRHSMQEADEIYAFTPADKKMQQLTYENKHIYDQITRGEVKERWIKTTDNKQMLAWVIYPPHFDPNKKYPTLLYCQGGPQSPVSQFWSYRWNFQMMAANGYIVIAPNRRGLPGFGQEWLEEISGDYSGQCMDDYFSAIDDICTEPYVDKDNLGCVGASFGGYSVYWLAGHHQKRFKAFIAHDGIFNMQQQYLETEEMWFAQWDMGGAYWDKNNKVAQRTFANSPHLFVDKWDTPILCIHGEKDYRILAAQGMSAFNAAKLRGVPAELLIYPDENHWVLQPQNGILWQRTFFGWLDKWLKK